MVNVKELTYAHQRWKHGDWSRLVLSHARALESVMTLNGAPAKKGWKYFRAPMKEMSSRE
jgi:hypothetical protein